ncbi:MAG: transposase [Ekhidna sp.]|nr:transposase [Ekhidna sp.]
MTKKKRKSFSKEIKEQAVDDYISGAKSAQQIADEIGADIQLIYRWKVLREENAKGARIDEFMSEGADRAMAEKLLQKELEIEAYQKKVAEQAVIIDLLKKLQTSPLCPPESELTGLIKTSRGSAQKRKRAKK